jgi:hypothetical protein
MLGAALFAVACGSAGSALAAALLARSHSLEIIALDNRSQPGSERAVLAKLGVPLRHLSPKAKTEPS